MGRISDIASGKTSVGGGRLSGVVSSESAVKEKNQYYLEVQKKSRYEEAIKKAEKAQEEAQKAAENLKFWEGIAGIPKQIYQAGKETGAAILDTAVRTSPLESVINTASGISSVVSGPANVPASLRYNQGVQESKGRKTLFEKVSGKELTNPDGSINWDAGRQFIGRAAEAPTYVYSGAVQGAEMAGKGLLTRLLTRTIKSTPEASVNTGIQQFEQGNTENIGTNFLANALLLSGISNIAGEVRFSKEVAKKTISDIESEIGTLSLSEKADVLESIKQGVKPADIVENVRKVKNNEVAPEELATKINEQAGVSEPKQKTEVKTTPEDPLLQEARKYKSAEDFVKAQEGGRFHGTSREIEKLSDGDSMYSPQNIYGQGFYTTDNLSVAEGYMKKGKGGEPGVYKVSDKNNTSLYDIEKPMPADLLEDVNKFDIADYVPWKEGQSLREVYDDIRELSASGEFSADVAQEYFDSLRTMLESRGFRGIEHIGGGLTAGKSHVVKIYWYPEKDLSVTKSVTKSQLTDIWNRAQEKPIDTSLPEQPKPDVTPTTVEKGESVTAKKMNERFGKDEQMSTEYDVIGINNESDKAASLILKDRNKAIKTAFTDTGSNTEKIAILNELFEKSVVDNDHELSTVLFNRIKQLSTQTAQSLNMFKALTEVNPHYSYMSEVVSARLNGVRLSAGNIIDALKKESKQSRVRTKLSKQTQELKETLSNSVKYEKAQKVFNDLIC